MFITLDSQVVSQGPCPKCSSSDAFTEYDDGHCKCYSCGYFVATQRIHILNKTDIEEDKTSICLPTDSDSGLPVSALAWLDSYGISLTEARQHKFKWSEKNQLLIFPVYGYDSTLIYWQGRYFGKEKKPKYNSRGKSQEIFHVLSPDKGEEIILTEDLISAIKVSRQFPAMPIWGSHISMDTFKHLFLLFPKVAIWLDADKFSEAIGYALKGSQLGSTRVIYTKEDPKWYGDKEILDIIRRK